MTRAVILAAGQGTRLRPYTNDKPKALVELFGKALIEHQLDTLKHLNIENVAVVTGYKAEQLVDYGYCYHNPNFASSNMVQSLFCAERFFERNADLLVCYGDIIYKPKVLESLLNDKRGICVVADLQWKEFWELRMDNPLEDAETFKVDCGRIIELGGKPKSYDEIHAQYIGLIKIPACQIHEIVDFYHSLDKKAYYDGKKFSDMYMTTFLQLLINNSFEVYPTYINRGWLEVDTVADLETYQRTQGVY
ncbi:NTP transferase domain-containing protein [Catenovulum sediminis]|uniref:phosphocholine cytidylyltransferase family protein n=1 Tax=Catenovulum sediminis TaxID=1740262 RepID=UPI00118080CD|nr:phosphocholine cytidylyltransferase family protein [Catenovulum sediminis]